MRAKPILASAAMALSLTACQWMGDTGQQQAAAPAAAGPTAQQVPGQFPQPQFQQQPQAQMQMQQQPAWQPQARMQQPERVQSVNPQLVQQVQRNLGQQGYNPGPQDGIWGDRTRTALQNFQRDQGLRQSGQLDHQTIAALGIGDTQIGMQPQQQRRQQVGQQQMRQQPMMGQQQMRQQPQQAQQQGISPNVVRNLQQELSDRGYQVGPVDGVWGSQTQQALANFQRDRNLQATGQIDRQTLAALGLDAQIGERPDLQQQRLQQQDQLGQQPGFRQQPQQRQQPDIGPN